MVRSLAVTRNDEGAPVALVLYEMLESALHIFIGKSKYRVALGFVTEVAENVGLAIARGAVSVDERLEAGAEVASKNKLKREDIHHEKPHSRAGRIRIPSPRYTPQCHSTLNNTRNKIYLKRLN